MTGLSLSASLVVYKPDLAILERTLSALQIAGHEAKKVYDARLELTLVDNSDEDFWFSRLQAWVTNQRAVMADWNLHLLRSSGNLGYGRGNNLVIERAVSEYHLVINPDLFVEPDALLQSIRFMEENQDVALLTPAIFGENGERHYLCKRYPTLFIMFLRSYAPKWLKSRFQSELDRFEMRDCDYNEQIENVQYPSGCFMFFRTRLLRQQGGFDPSYFLHFEDADLGRRMLGIGRVVYVPSVKVEHLWERGTHKDWRLRWITVKSALIYFKKWGGLF